MERKLLLDFIDGQEIALQKIIDKYNRPLLRYCYSIVLDYHEAQDILQETFLKAYKNRNQFDADTSISAWLYRIAYTTSVNTLKKKKRFWNYVIKKHSDVEYIHEPLRTTLLKLKDYDRALLVGRVIEEQSYNEIEKILQIPAATLRKRFERIRKKMMCELSSSYPQYSMVKKKELEG